MYVLLLYISLKNKLKMNDSFKLTKFIFILFLLIYFYSYYYLDYKISFKK